MKHMFQYPKKYWGWGFRVVWVIFAAEAIKQFGYICIYYFYSFEMCVDMLDYMDDILGLEGAGKNFTN